MDRWGSNAGDVTNSEAYALHQADARSTGWNGSISPERPSRADGVIDLSKQ